MLLRLFALFAVLSLVLTPSLVLGEEKEQKAEGTVVKTADGKLTVKGKDDKEHTCTVAKDAKITCNGKECKLDDLKAGTKVKVTLTGDKDKKAVKIEATTK